MTEKDDVIQKLDERIERCKDSLTIKDAVENTVVAMRALKLLLEKRG